MLQKKKHFVFGYGSLICPKSRAIMAPTIAQRGAQPAMLEHFQRIWAKRGKRMTYVGVRPLKNAQCTGVLLEVDDVELKQFDARESGYDRVAINLKDIKQLPFLPNSREDKANDKNNHIVFEAAAKAQQIEEAAEQPEAKETAEAAELQEEKENYASLHVPPPHNDVHVWVYVPQNPALPTSKYPIAQSYVDIILRGCLSISEEFARHFVETTHGWWYDPQKERFCIMQEPHHTWVNDRPKPIYVRADFGYSRSLAHRLDDLLREHQRLAMKKRKYLKNVSM